MSALDKKGRPPPSIVNASVFDKRSKRRLNEAATRSPEGRQEPPVGSVFKLKTNIQNERKKQISKPISRAASAASFILGSQPGVHAINLVLNNQKAAVVRE